RYLAHHLERAGREADLHAVLAAETPGREDGSRPGYLADHLERAGREGGLDAALAAETPGLDDGYGPRNLPHHLERVGHAPHTAPTAEAPGSGRNVWYAAHEAAGTVGDYLNDVHRARRLVAARVDGDIKAGRAAAGLGLE